MGTVDEAFKEVCERYSETKTFVRELMTDEVFHTTGIRVEVRPIGDEVLGTVLRSWCSCPHRLAKWDWDDTMRKLRTYGPRTLDLAFYAGYPKNVQLCGLIVAKVSPHRRWLSLTHVEGAPTAHPLKGLVLPFAVLGLRRFRTLISSEDEAEKMGLRILFPSKEALPMYASKGYTDYIEEKKLSYIVVEPPKA